MRLTDPDLGQRTRRISLKLIARDAKDDPEAGAAFHWPGQYPDGEQRIMAEGVDLHIDKVAANDAYLKRRRLKGKVG